MSDTPPSDPGDGLSALGWARRGFGHGFGLPAVMLMCTMCGIGGLVRDIGYPVWAGTLSTLLIWAGPAQVVLFGAVAAGASLPATALAVSLSSARFLPMTVSVLPLARAGGASLPATVLAAHLVSMTTWVEGLRRLPNVPLAGRMPYFLGYAFAIIGAGMLATHAGFYLYAVLPALLAAALLFTTPLFFTAAMMSSARTMADWIALGSGLFGALLLSPLLPSGLDFLLIGLVGGTAAYAVQRRAGRGAA